MPAKTDAGAKSVKCKNILAMFGKPLKEGEGAVVDTVGVKRKADKVPDLSSPSKRQKTEKPDQEGKKKKKKKNKDPNKPKKAKSAYTYFIADKQEVYRKETENFKLSEMMKALGEVWKKLSEADRKQYVDKAAADKERYKTEMQSYTPPAGMEVDEAVGKKKGKGKKSKKKKAPQAKTAYMLYCEDLRPKLKEELPTLKPTEMLSKLAERWKQADEATQKEYKEKAEAAKKEFKEKQAAAAEAAKAEDAMDEDDEPIVKPTKKKGDKKKQEPQRAASEQKKQSTPKKGPTQDTPVGSKEAPEDLEKAKPSPKKAATKKSTPKKATPQKDTPKPDPKDDEEQRKPKQEEDKEEKEEESSDEEEEEDSSDEEEEDSSDDAPSGMSSSD